MSHRSRLVAFAVASAVALAAAAWLAWQGQWLLLLIASPIVLLILGLLVQTIGIKSREEP